MKNLLKIAVTLLIWVVIYYLWGVLLLQETENTLMIMWNFTTVMGTNIRDILIVVVFVLICFKPKRLDKFFLKTLIIFVVVNILAKILFGIFTVTNIEKTAVAVEVVGAMLVLLIGVDKKESNNTLIDKIQYLWKNGAILPFLTLVLSMGILFAKINSGIFELRVMFKTIIVGYGILFIKALELCGYILMLYIVLMMIKKILVGEVNFDYKKKLGKLSPILYIIFGIAYLIRCGVRILKFNYYVDFYNSLGLYNYEKVSQILTAVDILIEIVLLTIIMIICTCIVLKLFKIKINKIINILLLAILAIISSGILLDLAINITIMSFIVDLRNLLIIVVLMKFINVKTKAFDISALKLLLLLAMLYQIRLFTIGGIGALITILLWVNITTYVIGNFIEKDDENKKISC